MLRSYARLAAVLAALAVASPVLAEEKGQAAAPSSHLAVGVSLTAFDLTGAQVASPVPATADVLVGFDLGQFRLEPSLGISRYAIDGGSKGSDLNLGCGLLIPLRPGKSVSIYVGPRLFLGFVSAKSGAGYSDSTVDFTLAAALGAEWFADPRFSIGAEARLSYAILGDLSDAGVVLRDSATVFATSAHVYFRFYL
jgi:hypothetical protein